MNRPYILLTAILIVLPITLSGTPSTDRAVPIGKLLKRLDRTISMHSHYQREREIFIDSLKTLPAITLKDSLDKYEDLFNEYLSFQTDSAIHYALLKRTAALRLNDSLEILEADLNLAQVYSIAGLNNEAFDILKAMSHEKFSPFLQSYWYNVYTTLYETQYQLIDNLELKQKYHDLLHQSYISLHSCQSPDKDGSSYWYTLVNILMLENRYSEAKSLLKANKEKIVTNSREEAIYYWFLAGITLNGELDRETAKRYFAHSAIIDISLGIKEHLSLQQLAYMLYTDGDLKRAHRYMKVSLEDANFCNSQKRIIKVSQLLPIIDNDWQMQRNRRQMTLYVCLAVFAVLILMLAIALTYINRLLRANRIANSNLKETNRKQQEMNLHLEESNIIKETYIVRYMDFCLKYIDSMENRLKRIGRHIRNNEQSALKKALDPTLFAKKNLEVFYENFDSTFLNLFPTFIDDYNSLLKPEFRIRMKSPAKLNTELRICALIRLGISDSSQIAHFLHCSLSTVYNNRVTARNKACVNRDDFEKQVSKIGSISGTIRQTDY